MSVFLDHTLVNVADKQASASFVAEILGLGEPTPYGPFLEVPLANDMSLYFIEVDVLHAQHYAFLVSDPEFDEIMTRITERGVAHWADPAKQRLGEINTDDGGRGVYWEEPSGHLLEAITRHYGTGR